MNCTDLPAADSCDQTCCRCGISATHGPHHWPHTFRTRTWSLASATFQRAPCNVVPLKVNGLERLSTARRSMLPSPETYPLRSPDLACAAMELASEPHPETPKDM